MSNERPRILVADDHALIVEGLRRVLEPAFDIVGVATNGRDLVAQAEQLKPDIVLLDIGMPILNGMEASRQIKKLVPTAKLVFVTQKSDRSYVHIAFRNEASGYILKQSLASELIPALHEVLAGRFYVTPLVSKDIPQALLNPNRNPSELFGNSLTGRQREVLQLVAEGKTGKEIAGILKISPKTVEFHKSGIMEELGLRTTAELTRYAIEHGIVGE
ncbi:MAG TPA: response regulator transcription factor [Bryobacteraceae bacterium]|nr:response regulator transcription factor [Bryobacteraceae bacterium]